MAPKPTSITLDQQTRDRLDRVAKAYERKRSWIIGRAIQEYLEREEAFARTVEAGLESADRGPLIAHEDVMAEMDALIDELAPPQGKRATSKRATRAKTK